MYVREREDGPLVFLPLPTPTSAEVADVARRTAERIECILRAHGRSLDPQMQDDEPPAAKKATWLYAVAPALPALRWGLRPDSQGLGLVERWGSRRAPVALVSWCGNRVASGVVRPRLGKKAANATPPEFRDMLLDIARSCLPNDGMSLRNPADRDDFALPRAEDVEATS